MKTQRIPEAKYIGTIAVARLLECSPPTVLKLDPVLKPTVYGGRRIYDRDQVLAYLKARRPVEVADLVTHAVRLLEQALAKAENEQVRGRLKRAIATVDAASSSAG